MPDPVLAVRNLTKSFGGVLAVNEVSFAINPGERVALIGPNGAGKTTLINLISGLLRPDGGTAQLNAQDISAASAQARCKAGMARTFQIASAFGQLDVITNVALAIAEYDGQATWNPFAGLPAPTYGKARDILDRVDLNKPDGTMVSALAYGETKRLELAIALASEPRLLLLDEPMAGVGRDGETNLVATATDALLKEGGGNRALLFTEHDMDVVFDQATRILVLDQGSLIADGKPDQVANDDLVRAVYLGEELAL
ncbi:MAG: ABC transporter ATP-binding protein [Alphaproteobacteria bacterium]|nr:ABC transporter ATP-binding protein [Alphaproteobacteria bacterium SS10]